MISGVIAALSAAFFSTSKDIGSKSLSSNVSGAASSVGSFLFALPFYICLLLTAFFFFGERSLFVTAPMFYVILCARALSDALGESAKMYALGQGDLSTVSIFLSFLPIFVLFLSPVITGDPLSSSVFIGTFFVVSGSLIATSSKNITKKGAIYALLAAIFMATNTCLDRLAAQSGHPFFAAACMTFFALIFTLPLFLFDGHPKELLKSRKIFLLRGFFELLFMVAKLFALISLTAPQVMVILRCALVLNVLAGKFIFQETQSVRKLCASFLILFGIWIAV